MAVSDREKVKAASNPEFKCAGQPLTSSPCYLASTFQARHTPLASKPAATRTGCISVAAHARHYFLYTPAHNRAQPHRLLIALHGGGDNARRIARYSRFNQQADERGDWLIVYPLARISHHLIEKGRDSWHKCFEINNLSTMSTRPYENRV